MEQETFQATTPSFDDQVYQDWLKDYKTRTGDQVAFDETERKAFNTKTNKDRPLDYSKWYQGDDTEAHADWKAFQYKRERDRFNSLPPVQQDQELVANTHKYEETPILGRFAKSFTKAFTMGLAETGEDDNPVYGKRVSERYGAVSTAGSFLGEVANFVVLSQVAAGLKVPQAIGRVAEGSSQAATLLRATGGVNYKLSQINKIIDPLRWFGAKTAPAIGAKYSLGAKGMAEAAGEATTAALIMGFKNTVAKSVERFRAEDQMTEKKYLESIPAGMRDFLVGAGTGYLVSAINAPSAWSLRFMGDSIYSTATQGYDILTGAQEGWNKERFLYDFLLGHVFGEIQGKLLNPFEKRLHADKHAENILNEVKTRLDPLGIPKDEQLRAASSILVQSAQQASKTGSQLNDVQIKKAADIVAIPYKDEVMHSIIVRKDFSDTHEIDLRSVEETLNKTDDEAYTRAARSLNWSDETKALAKQMRVIEDPQALAQFVMKHSKDKPFTAPKYGTREEFHSELMKQSEKVLKIPYDEIEEIRLSKDKKYKADKLQQEQDAELNAIDTKQMERDAADAIYKNPDGSLNSEGKRLEAVRMKVAEMASAGWKEERDGKMKRVYAKVSGKFTSDEKMDIRQDVAMKMLEQPLSAFADPEMNHAAYIQTAVRNLAATRAGGGAGADQYKTAKVVVTEIVNGKKVKRVKKADAPMFVKNETEVEGEEGVSTRQLADEISFQRWKDQPNIENALLDLSKKTGKSVDALQAMLDEKVHVLSLDQEIKDFGKAKELIQQKQHYIAAFAMQMSSMGYKYDEVAAVLKRHGVKVADGVAISGMVRRFRAKLKDKVEEHTSSEKIAAVQKDIEATRARINRKTGIEKNIDAYEKSQIKAHGAMVLNFDAHYYWFLRTEGARVADRLLTTGAAIVKKHIAEINSRLGKGQRVMLRNPDAEDGTRMVLIQEGLKEKQFQDIALDVQNILTKNYDNADPGKKFAVVIRTVDGRSKVVAGFKDITLTHTKDPEAIIGSSYDAQVLKQIVNMYGDDITKSVFSRAMFDTTDQRFIDAVNSIKDRFPFVFQSSQQWKEALGDDTARAAGLKAAVRNAAAVIDPAMAALRLSDGPRAPVREQARQYAEQQNSGHKMSPEEMIDDSSRARDTANDDLTLAIEKDSYFKEQSSAPIDDAQLEGTANFFTWMKSFFADMRKQAADKQGPIAKAATSVREFVEDKFNVYGRLEKSAEGRHIIGWLHNWGAKPDEISGVEVMSLLRDATSKYTDKMTPEQFDVLNKFGELCREKEFKALMKLDENGVALNEKSGIQDDIHEPMKWSKKTGKPQDYDELMKNPATIPSETILKWSQMSEDPLFYAKVITQTGGVNTDAFLGLLKDTHNLIYKAAENEYFKYLPDSKGGMDLERGKEFIADAIINMMSSRAETRNIIEKYKLFDLDGMLATIKEGKEITMPIKKVFAQIADEMEKVDENFAKALRVRTREYYDMDPSNLTYVKHRVIQDRFNNRKMWSETYARQSGDTIRGKKAMDSALIDFNNRTFSSLESVIEAGFDVDLHFFEGMHSMLTTLKVKNLNRYVSENFKNQYCMDFAGALKTYAAGKRSGEVDAHKVFEQFIDEHGGYFYMPSQRDIKKMREISERNPGEQNSEIRLESMELLDAFFKGKLPDELGKKTGLSVTEAERAALDSTVIAARVIGDDVYLPMNKKDWLDARHGYGKGATVLDAMHDHVEKYRLNAPSIFGWDGIYLHKDIHNTMRQFVSRDDFYKSGNHYYFLEKLEKGYGRVNSFLKVIRLIKPTIMMVNNMFQGLTANPAFLLHLPWAYRTYFKRFEKGAFGNEEYWLFNGANLFNRASAPEGLVPDATRAAYELAGKNITMSKMADDMAGKNFFQKAGVAATYGFKRWQEFSWAIDDMFRLAICKSFYDRAGRTYTDKRQAASVSAALTNTMMVEYSRIPTHTRMALNRVFLYPTYRIGTMRMFKEMAQMGVRGIRGIVNGEIKDTPYRLYNDPKKQAFFEMGFAFRTVAVQAATKAAAAIFLGYGADTIFQAMFDYRAKKKTGDDQYDQDIKILSMSGPIFDLSKYFSRPLEVTLRYNMAAFPGLIVSWATNKNIITQQRIVTADWKKEPQKALAQVGLDLFRTYLPFSGEYCNWADKDLAIAEKIINEFGIGYFYSQENPKSILTDFLAATDKAKTIGEQKKAWADYKYKMDRASRVLTGVAFKSVQDERKAQQELLDATTKN